MSEVERLSHATSRCLQGAILWESAGAKLEVEEALLDIEPAQLDLAIAAVAEVLEKLRRIRGEAAALAEAVTG